MLQFEDKQISENRSKNFDQSLEEKISECIENLEKNPEHLNHADLQIIKTFARKNQFFKQIQEEQGENILKECFKRITLEVYEKNQVVFEQGERAHSFFIILIGNVSVYVYKDPKVDIGEENLDRPTLIKMKSFNTNKLVQGQSFGEMALLSDSLRSASIICDSRCIFCVLSKKDYKQILQKEQEDKINQQLKEFYACMKYQNISLKLLEILFIAFQNFPYQFRQIVYFQGQENKQEIYLIKSGEFLITKNNDNQLNGKKSVKQIALLQKGQFFGDHECFLNLEKRQYNVICNSENGIVLKIQLSNLIQRLQSSNQMHLYDQLRKSCLQREKNRSERISRQLNKTENFQIDMKYVKQRNLTYQAKSVRSARRNTFSIRSPLQMVKDVIKNKKTIYFQLYKEEDYRHQSSQKLDNILNHKIQQLRRKTQEQLFINDQKYIN